MKSPAVREETVEKGAQDVGFCPGHATRQGHVLSTSFLQDHLADALRRSGCLSQFFPGDGEAVYVKSRQADVGVGHLEGIGTA